MIIYKLTEVAKLYEYMRLDKEQTCLSFEILVDDCKSYKRDVHPLLVFVKTVENEYIPISVTEYPQMLDQDMDIRISCDDIEKIKNFVSVNADLIHDFANEKIDVRLFLKSIIRIDDE